jgi:hypothetical protein
MLSKLTIQLFYSSFSLLLPVALSIGPLFGQGDCEVMGGTISLPDGSDSLSICAGDGTDDFFDVHLADAEGESSSWVITDADLNILGLPPGPPFNLEGAGGGLCLVWHLAHDGSLTGAAVGENANDLGGCFDLSNPISVRRFTGGDCAANVAYAGSIELSDGDTDAAICADGTPDPLGVVRDGMAQGSNRTFVITDSDGMILNIPEGNGPFDLDGAGPGTCLIWYLAYTDGLGGLTAGENVDDLEGTFDLSNAITVNRYEGENCITQIVNGGRITLAGSMSTDTSICIDGNADPLEVTLDGMQEGPNRTFVITDSENNILNIPAGNGPFNLEGAGPGTCLIWYLTYADGLEGLMMGASLDSIVGTSDLSNAITVVRQAPDGGRVTVANGDTVYMAVAGNVLVPVSFTTTATALNYWYVITDANGNILNSANARSVDTLNLSGAPIGTCRIYGWSYRGLDPPVAGESISTLTDDDCEAISANYIEVVRNATAAGGLTLSEIGSDGRIEILNGGNDSINISSYWLCTFPQYQALSELTVECGELTLAPGEVVVVSGFSGFSAADGELGLYTREAFGDSDAIVSYLEWGSGGHQRSSVAIEAGLWRSDFFLEPPTEDNSLQYFSDVTDNWIRQESSFCVQNVNMTSTSPPLAADQVRLFPNPVHGQLTVELHQLSAGRTTVEILDPNGRRIERRTMANGNGRHVFSLAGVPAGTYFLRVVNEGRALTRRVVRF